VVIKEAQMQHLLKGSLEVDRVMGLGDTSLKVIALTMGESVLE